MFGNTYYANDSFRMCSGRFKRERWKVCTDRQIGASPTAFAHAAWVTTPASIVGRKTTSA